MPASIVAVTPQLVVYALFGLAIGSLFALSHTLWKKRSSRDYDLLFERIRSLVEARAADWNMTTASGCTCSETTFTITDADREYSIIRTPALLGWTFWIRTGQTGSRWRNVFSHDRRLKPLFMALLEPEQTVVHA